jgi:hypothetical protein
LQCRTAFFERPELTALALDLIDPIAHLLALSFQTANPVLDGLSVDRTHDDLPKVVVAFDRAPRRIVIEQTGEEVDQFRLVRVGFALDRDAAVLTRIPGDIGLLTEREFDASFVRVGFERPDGSTECVGQGTQ